MREWQSRTQALLGERALELLSGSRVAVLGLGGVGGTAAEALVRCGVGHLLLVDRDVVEESNLNRQILATHTTLGLSKAQAARERFLAINPEADLDARQLFYLPENGGFLEEYAPHYVVDAMDNVTAKLDLAQRCREKGIPLISCLGTGNRMDPGALRIGDVAETAGCGCPLARVMRRELKKRGLSGLTVLYSAEYPARALAPGAGEHGSHSPASSPFVPPAAGYLLAAYVVREILGKEEAFPENG